MKKLQTLQGQDPFEYRSLARPLDKVPESIHDLERIIDKITSSNDPSDEDFAAYERYRTQVQFEMRRCRFSIFRRLYDINNAMLDRMERSLLGESQEDFSITPAQMRLYLTMFLDQTRTEFEDKDVPDILIDQRKQQVNIQVIEVEKTYEADTVNGKAVHS